MAARKNHVTLDSGPPEASCLLRDVPLEQWGELLRARRDFLAVKISYDCRQLVHFMDDALELWRPLGFADADDLIRRGLELEPEEIRLALRWLEINEPQARIAERLAAGEFKSGAAAGRAERMAFLQAAFQALDQADRQQFLRWACPEGPE
jgi:hypothetical protein